jgi:hypothetical protein
LLAPAAPLLAEAPATTQSSEESETHFLRFTGDSKTGGRLETSDVTFKNDAATLPGVVVATSTNIPIVLVDPAAPVPQSPSVQGHVVLVSVFWKIAGDPTVHNYTTTGVVGSNPP